MAGAMTTMPRPSRRRRATDRPVPGEAVDTRALAEAGRALLAWYRRHARRLPWRLPPGARERADPYRVWLSEVMLQQTTVAAVVPYFEAFLERWPTVEDLAAAPVEEVMAAWAGLGYYSRARNLKACAEAVVTRHGGAFPDTVEGLAALPGIGAYTSAAVAAIAFGRPATVIDGNVERVLARLLAVDVPPKEARPRLEAALEAMSPKGHPGDFAQGMMDLGATVCTPKRPVCALCPLAPACRARADGTADAYPVKPAKAARPKRTGAAFVAVRSDGAVLLRRRPDKGLLGGMAEVPTTDWEPGFDLARALGHAPFRADWRRLDGGARHVFTHFELELAVFRADLVAGARPPRLAGTWWAPAARIDEEALPTVMTKVIALAGPEIGLAGRGGRRGRKGDGGPADGAAREACAGRGPRQPAIRSRG